MNSSLLIATGASFVAGLLGYTIVRLWIKPIVRYTTIKRKLDRELNRYLANIEYHIANNGDRSEPSQGGDATPQMARKHAMDLVSCYGTEIPYWYRLLLDSRRESPSEASGLLTNLSKIRDLKQVKKRIDGAQKGLRLR